MDSTGLGDSRITARMMPSVTPISMEKIVSRIVPRTPAMIGGRNALSTMNAHWKWSFVMSMCKNIETSTARTAIATQRPGCRTGTALIGSGRARSSVISCVAMPVARYGFTADVLMPPASTPHRFRIVAYVPSSISFWTAPEIASAKSFWSLLTT